MITQQNYFDRAHTIFFKNLPPDLQKGHHYIENATNHGDSWSAYFKNENIKRVMDKYFAKLDDYLTHNRKGEPAETKITKKPELITVERFDVTPSPTHKPKIAIVHKSAPVSDEMDVEFTERIPDEIKFIRRFLSLHNREKTKEDLLRFINALHRAIVERRVRKTSPYAKQINYIQEKLVARYNEMDKPQTMEINDDTRNELKALVNSEKIMPSVMLMKRYITLNGKYDVKEKAKKLIEAMKKANEKGLVKKSDKYIKILDKMYDTLTAYVKSKTMKILNITEPELNGLNGVLVGYENQGVDGYSEEFNGLGSIDTEQEAKVIPLHNGVMSSMDFNRMRFNTLGFTGKYLKLIGDPCRGFSVMVFAKPKMGKSYLCVDFAGYLSHSFGKVLYVAKEEGLNKTLQQKVIDQKAANPNLFIASDIPEDLTPYDHIFLDSVNSIGLSAADLLTLKHNYPDKSFIYVFQVNKDGKVRGTNEYMHNVDCVIEIPEKGLAVQNGRFNQGGEMQIFEDDQYKQAA